ncbi:ATP dependent DNA ligase-like protein [Rhizobium azibense]|uniref:ATP dependent DNA ligase-like protein n=1 Tax=Rhizobium azibense TaxID=1136135 RepID=A0A4R3R6H1_9HYPH|nr:ATP dependent DNA ligase-like protein [Rhizobium azibense]
MAPHDVHFSRFSMSAIRACRIAIAKKLGVATAILDGEAVVLDEKGRSDFGLLQQSLGGRGGKRTSDEAIFMAFDLLYFEGRDLRKLEFTARRHLLEGLIESRDDVIRLSEETWPRPFPNSARYGSAD